MITITLLNILYTHKKELLIMTNKFAIIGCGGMGFRHLLGYIEYLNYDHDLELVAVVDPNKESSKYLSDHYLNNTGKKINSFNTLDELNQSNLSLDSVDITSTNDTHHQISIDAMKLGLDVMCEKPVALDISLANKVLNYKKKLRRHFALFENFRRDPINRLTKYIVDSKEFGESLYATDFESSYSFGRVMHGTGWRAKKDKGGGIVLDAGIHNADLLIYFLGSINSVTGSSKILLPERSLISMEESDHNLKSFYKHRVEEYKNNKVFQDSVDTIFSTIEFNSGAIASVIISDAIPNLSVNESWIYGSKLSLLRTKSRSGQPIKLIKEGLEITGEKVLEEFPEFKLDYWTQNIFGDFIDGGYSYDFSEYDRKVIAIEYLDFIKSKLSQEEPEVGIIEGINSLSLAYAFIESGYLSKKIIFEEFINSNDLNYFSSN